MAAKRMWNLLLITVSFHLLNGHPITEKNTFQKEMTREHQPRTPNVVSYIKNFRNIMVHYVFDVQKEKYNLTDHAMTGVQTELTEFLMTFAHDVKDVLAANKNVTFEKNHILKDGLTDSTFEEIKNKLKFEFPEVKEETADEIVYKLRLNLYRTKVAINDIVELSKSDIL